MPKIAGELGERRSDALGAVSRKSPEDRSTDAHRPRTQRQGHEHVQTGPDSTVDEYGYAAADGLDDFPQRQRARDRAVELPTAVVGDDHARGTGVEALDRRITAQDAFDDDRQAGQPVQPLDRAQPDGGS